MPHFTDERLARKLAAIDDRLSDPFNCRSMEDSADRELVVDLIVARQTIAELNASNQQLAQTIKDMDAGYRRNVQRFEKIQRRAQRILDFERLNVITDHRLTWIVSLAKDGIAEEGDNP